MRCVHQREVKSRYDSGQGNKWTHRIASIFRMKLALWKYDVIVNNISDAWDEEDETCRGKI